jgi:hypothetical protein
VAPGVSAAVLATVHPAFVLIQPEESYGRWREVFFGDVRALAERSREVSGLKSQVPRPDLRPET